MPLLGLHPGADIDSYATGALISATAQTAGRRLDGLARAHLICITRPGRYGMHDLLGGYTAGIRQRPLAPARPRPPQLPPAAHAHPAMPDREHQAPAESCANT